MNKMLHGPPSGPARLGLLFVFCPLCPLFYLFNLLISVYDVVDVQFLVFGHKVNMLHCWRFYIRVTAHATLRMWRYYILFWLNSMLLRVITGSMLLWIIGMLCQIISMSLWVINISLLNHSIHLLISPLIHAINLSCWQYRCRPVCDVSQK